MLATQNAEIAVAVERFEPSSDTKLMHQAIVREKTERDYYSSLDWAEQKGRLEGLQQGMQQGMQQGEHNKACETAKNLKTTSLSVREIAKATGLSEDEVKTL